MKKVIFCFLFSLNRFVLNLRDFFGFRRKIVFYFYLIQDLDILLPTLEKFQNSPFFLVEAWVTPQLMQKSPRTVKALVDLKIKIKKAINYRRINLKFNFLGVSAFFTSAETTAQAHRLAHNTVKIANCFGVKTFTFQHGLENIGLTYFDKEFPPEFVDFASQTIFLWGHKQQLHPKVKEETKRKCVSVGCPKHYFISNLPRLNRPPPLVAIFENLHWSRYSGEYRSAFLNSVVQVAQVFKEVSFLLKPHHAGQWLTTRFEGTLNLPDNLIILDPSNAKWEPYTAPAVIAMADVVITTPSTTAFDAAKIGKPVAVVANELELPLYQPLKLLFSEADWIEFIKQALDRQNKLSFLKCSDEFISKIALSGDGATNIYNLLLSELSV